MNRKLLKASLAAPIALALTAGGVALAADPQVHEAHAGTYDPAHTNLVASGWIAGIGCPTNAGVSTTGGNKPDTTYTDPACSTGDPKDNKNEGLLLAKTGPTGNYAAGVVDIKDAKGITLQTLGYDIRKTDSPSDSRGSHCGAGAPRFNVYYSDGSIGFLGCNSPAAQTVTAGNGWLRLRWDASQIIQSPNHDPAATVSGLQIVFDEGQDASGGPDEFGLAVLDNIDVNGTLIGQGNAGDLH